ncbi:MAG: hypothetical protein ACPGO7_00305 [Alphaproteobacteria bacterium]|jgi:hypothetical protein
MKVKVLVKSISTSAGLQRQDDIVDLPDAEAKKIMFMKPHAFEVIQEMPAMKKAPAKKKRARNANGTLKADDPSTPDINEAYE